MQLKIKKRWIRFWMKFDPLGPIGRLASFLAAWQSPPYKARCFLSSMNPKGYISHSAQIGHQDLILKGNVFIGDNVVIHQAGKSTIILEKGVELYRDIIIETGDNAHLVIGEATHIQPRCSIMAHVGSIYIGKRVEIAPNCAFYSYNHGFFPEIPIRKQKCSTKGGIFIDDDVWLGFGVIVLDGVRIGSGAVVGAGSLVTKDIPSNAIAYGSPARVVRLRENIKN